VDLANKHDVVLIPYGGGTNVTNSLELSTEEKRMIVSVDMSRMNRVKWVDTRNMTACVEAGIVGSDLEKALKEYGVCCGHEPVWKIFDNIF
jgi:alkyldihydroxyacetonephosphate synthase